MRLHQCARPCQLNASRMCLCIACSIWLSSGTANVKSWHQPPARAVICCLAKKHVLHHRRNILRFCCLPWGHGTAPKRGAWPSKQVPAAIPAAGGRAMSALGLRQCCGNAAQIHIHKAAGKHRLMRLHVKNSGTFIRVSILVKTILLHGMQQQLAADSTQTTRQHSSTHITLLTLIWP
jgi:hypothetical protein